MSKFVRIITTGVVICIINQSVMADQFSNTKTIDPYFGQYWDMDLAAAGSNESQPGDRLGESLSSGDFNGDGYPDLAIGSPKRNLFVNDAGAVLILYGNQSGATNTSSVLQFSNVVQEGEQFGTSLISGDFNNDGYDDLVVGAPYKDFTNQANVVFEDTGAVYVYYGSSIGLSNTGLFIDADDNQQIGTDRQAFAEFGFALASGDFNGDDFDDLVVSAPGQNFNQASNAGAIFIYYGGQVSSPLMGLDPLIRDSISQSSPNVSGSSETGDLFGFSLAAGDFNNNGYDDLAIGVPYETVGNLTWAGLVQVFYGNSLGLIDDDQIWEQSDITGALTESIDVFGFSLAVGDINGDGNDDLLIGAPFEDLGNIVDAGAAHYIPGSGIGLTTTGSLTFSQQTAGIFGTAETNDRFGYSLGVADLNVDGFAEAIVGVPFETNNGSESGFIHVLPGLSTGIDFAESSYLEGEQAGDNFGFAINQSENYFGPSLVVSASGKTSGDGDIDAGSVSEIFYLNPDIIFKDGFEFNLGK
ncbi:MAG: FG-GAP repeat protein [Xanthomonadales bacterium]|nr:FG-GAP repeat protein [Xanthomonadales bacterium]